MRSPPQTVFDSDPIVTTAGSIAAAGVAGRVKPRSTKVSSTMTVVPARRAARSTARRSASPVSAPVGLWKSGIRYASPGAFCRSAACRASTSQPPPGASGTGSSRAALARIASIAPE